MQNNCSYCFLLSLGWTSDNIQCMQFFEMPSMLMNFVYLSSKCTNVMLQSYEVQGVRVCMYNLHAFDAKRTQEQKQTGVCMNEKCDVMTSKVIQQGKF